mmetsp:Transcript_115273/g.287966  ORF Transcript_115273/g.287966 Transcript_115273/m.287966 type:complete len:675 (-) Transcript_115273:1280-3304(-)
MTSMSKVRLNLLARARAAAGTSKASRRSSRPSGVSLALRQRPASERSGALTGAACSSNGCDGTCLSCTGCSCWTTSVSLVNCASMRARARLASASDTSLPVAPPSMKPPAVFPAASSYDKACSGNPGGGSRPKEVLSPKCSAIKVKISLRASCLASGSICVSNTATLAPGSLMAMEPVAPSACPKPRTSFAVSTLPPLLLPACSKRKSCQPVPTSRQPPSERHSATLATLNDAARERLDSKTAGGATPEQSKRQRALAEARRPRPEAQPLAVRSTSEFTSKGSTHQGCLPERSCQESQDSSFFCSGLSRLMPSSRVSQMVATLTSSKIGYPTWAMRPSLPEYMMSSAKPSGSSAALSAATTDLCPVALRSNAPSATPSTRQGEPAVEENGDAARVSSIRCSLHMVLKSVLPRKGLPNPPWCCKSCWIVTPPLPPRPNSGHRRSTGVSRFMSLPVTVLREMAPKKQSSSTLTPTSSNGSSEASPPPPSAPIAATDGTSGAPAKPESPCVTSQLQSPLSLRTATCAPNNKPRFCNSSNLLLTTNSKGALPIGPKGLGTFSAARRGSAYFNIRRATGTVTSSAPHMSCNRCKPRKKKWIQPGIFSNNFLNFLPSDSNLLFSFSFSSCCLCSVSWSCLRLLTGIVSRKFIMSMKRILSRTSWSSDPASEMPSSVRAAR